jgi:hypothetical protein
MGLTRYPLGAPNHHSAQVRKLQKHFLCPFLEQQSDRVGMTRVSKGELEWLMCKCFGEGIQARRERRKWVLGFLF